MQSLRPIFLCFLCAAGLGSLTQSCASDDSSDCSGICGCGVDTTLTFATTVRDKTTGMPLSNIELYCHGEDTPIGTSDAMGAVGFSIQTQELPGCGYARCTNLRLHDPSGAKTDVEGTYFEFNNMTVQM